MHGKENMHEFKGEEGKMGKTTIGGYVSVIYESVSTEKLIYLGSNDCVTSNEWILVEMNDERASLSFRH